MSATTTDAPPATTRRGTPLARSWTGDWAARIEVVENELDRRICGARTCGGMPCPASSNHASGRCPHHGGSPLTGAPDGNRNAAVHMLYSRRLMPCGDHCPMWNRCPLGGGAADGGRELLKLKEVNRPTCPFEQAMYNAAVTDAERRTLQNQENGWGLHVAHTVALMTVMFSRAAGALATRPFTDKVESYQGEHLVLTERYAPQSVAFDKVGRELRRWTLLLEQNYGPHNCDPATRTRHRLRRRADTLPDPDSLFMTATAREIPATAKAECPAEDEQQETQKQRQALVDLLSAGRAKLASVPEAAGQSSLRLQQSPADDNATCATDQGGSGFQPERDPPITPAHGRDEVATPQDSGFT
jgi:hypothetical protein